MAKKEDIGALLLRVVVVIIYLSHGTVKFQGGIENIVGWFDSIGLPGFLAYMVASFEVVGGITLILGLGTRFVGGLFALLLVGAIIKVQFAAGFVGGYAYDLVLLVISAYLLLIGGKSYSFDNYLFKNKKEMTNK